MRKRYVISSVNLVADYNASRLFTNYYHHKMRLFISADSKFPSDQLCQCPPRLFNENLHSCLKSGNGGMDLSAVRGNIDFTSL